MARQATVRDLRRTTRAAVLRSLWFDGAASRQELSRRTALTSATVGNVVSELVQEGVLAEAGQLASAGGRPAVLVELVRDRHMVLGAEVGETGVTVELFDLLLERRSVRREALDPAAVEVRSIVEITAGSAAALLAEADVGAERVLGMGVGVPGIVEDSGEAFVHSQSLGWERVPLAGLLAGAVGVPVALDNGAKALGRAEARLGAGAGVDDVVVCLIGTGVGAAIHADGQPFRGATGSAGEWGHTVVALDGAPCRCGSQGCLEAYVGADAILERWRRESRGRAPIAGRSPEEAMGELSAQAAAGRPAAVRVAQETARYLGAGVASLVNLCNPQRIVLGGWVGMTFGEQLLPLVAQEAAARALAPPWRGVELALCELGPDAVAQGAAATVVDRFLSAGGAVRAQQAAQLGRQRRSV